MPLYLKFFSLPGRFFVFLNLKKKHFSFSPVPDKGW